MVIFEISEARVRELYQSFLKSVALCGFHRTQVKRGLIAYLKDATDKAEHYMTQHPYDKETYWRYIFSLLVVKYNYRHCELHTINSAIMAGIRYESLYDSCAS